MDMNERLKEMRNFLGLTQTDFGKRLGVTPTAISILESGKRNMTEQMILAICREYNANEEWLRTGEGGEAAMFNKTTDSILEAIMDEKKLDDMSRNILRAFLDLPPKKREHASNFIYALSRAIFESDVDSVYSDISHIIDNSNASGLVKNGLKSDVDIVFTDKFPHVGKGNIVVDETEAINNESELGISKENERHPKWNNGLTEEEEVALVRERHAALKKGLLGSTTYGKHGQSGIRKAK